MIRDKPRMYVKFARLLTLLLLVYVTQGLILPDPANVLQPWSDTNAVPPAASVEVSDTTASSTGDAPTPSNVEATSSTTGTTATPTQYTPNLADWSSFQRKIGAVSSVKNDTPEGITWLPPTAWKPWDGSIFNVTLLSRDTFYKSICVTYDTIVGLKELYHSLKPFANVLSPTKAEVDNWELNIIRHIRKIVGLGSNTIAPDPCLYVRALWSDQRKYTRQWDLKYPVGNCILNTNPHCGATFIPNPPDQPPYLTLPVDPPSCSLTAGPEGISSAPKSNIPWTVKIVRAFCDFLNSEGPYGGHVGPFWIRSTFGRSYYDWNTQDSNSNAIFRGKWGGPMQPCYFKANETAT